MGTRLAVNGPSNVGERRLLLFTKTKDLISDAPNPKPSNLKLLARAKALNLDPGTHSKSLQAAQDVEGEERPCSHKRLTDIVVSWQHQLLVDLPRSSTLWV